MATDQGTLAITAPATSANLGPGFDVLALALDLANEVIVRRRPGPLVVHVQGEGAGEVPDDHRNLVCRALLAGLPGLEDLEVTCRNRIPLGRGLGSSAAAVCAGLVAANALGDLRWSPTDILARAIEFEGHGDNAAACLDGGITALVPGPRLLRIEPPDGLALVVVIPASQVSTDAARGAMPAEVPIAVAARSISATAGLVLALERGHLDQVPGFLVDDLHQPHRGPRCPGFAALGAIEHPGLLGVTVSGSGPGVLAWALADRAPDVAQLVRHALAAEGVTADVRVARVAPTGLRARWQ